MTVSHGRELLRHARARSAQPATVPQPGRSADGDLPVAGGLVQSAPSPLGPRLSFTHQLREETAAAECLKPKSVPVHETGASPVFKLHDVVARTLGTSLNESMAVTFDTKLAASSLRFLDACAIPAIRDPLPPGVSDVHFRSDLSAVSVLSLRSLSDRDPLFRDLLTLDPSD